ncbi:MAG: M23 family metallopeptidase [bacterium]|nr:M23 family metallopeptidase [bacterium]
MTAIFPLSHTKRFLFVLLLLLSIALLTAPVIAQEPTPPAAPLGSPSNAQPVPTTTPIPRPAPLVTLSDGGFTLETYFAQIPQGQAGLIRVFGEGISGARGRFLDRIIDFAPAEDGYYALLAVGMEQQARVYELSVVAFGSGETRVTLTTPVEVTVGGFIRQDFTVAADRTYLLDTEIERNEFARLDSVFEPFTPQKLWTADGFRLPMNSELTSPFGAFRTLNQTFPTRHTGWDLRAAVGTPVAASAAGQVAFAGFLDIRGNYVVIDHGWGIYSAYAHFSQIHVTRGQSITAGQIIGVSGNTGRSNGPHLHWELVVDGQWIDAEAFLRMWLP